VADEIPELGMALLPQYRGQGIGTQLLGHLIGAAEQAGHPGLSLSVDPRNRVRRLYERFGFVLVGSDPGGSWTMVRRFGLDPAGR
jgi:ribosomal protein S18 acetylase RimI-like enzyme